MSREGSDAGAEPPAPLRVDYDAHPLLLPLALEVEYGRPLAEIDAASATVDGHLLDDLEVEGEVAERLVKDVRDLFRHGGHKPSGRGKPSSEYLRRAADAGTVPEINHAVDLCNAFSLRTRLPVSVVDLDRTEGPLRVGVCPSGAYVFNASGQEIRLDGLLCLFDASGPIANAVKDCHRTKTSPATTRTLSVLWAPTSHPDHGRSALERYAEIAALAPARVRTGRAATSLGDGPATLRWSQWSPSE